MGQGATTVKALSLELQCRRHHSAACARLGICHGRCDDHRIQVGKGAGTAAVPGDRAVTGRRYIDKSTACVHTCAEKPCNGQVSYSAKMCRGSHSMALPRTRNLTACICLFAAGVRVGAVPTLPASKTANALFQHFSRQSSSRATLILRTPFCSSVAISPASPKTRPTSASGQESSGRPTSANGSHTHAMLANRCPATPHARSPSLWLSIGTARERGARRRAVAAASTLGLVAARRSRLRQLPALTRERSAQPQQRPANDQVWLPAAARDSHLSAGHVEKHCS